MKMVLYLLMLMKHSQANSLLAIDLMIYITDHLQVSHEPMQSTQRLNI